MAPEASRAGGFLSRMLLDVQGVARSALAAGIVPERYKSTLASWSGYEAADKTRSRAGFTTENYGPNASLVAGAPTRARARDLKRNDPTARRIVNVTARDWIGSGITASADDTKAPKRICEQADAIWEAHGKRGVFDLQGLFTRDAVVAHLAKALACDGAAILRRVWDPDLVRQRAPVPWRGQALEIDMLADGLSRGTSGTNGEVTGGQIVQGVETNAIGRVVALHLHASHPSESFIVASYKTVRVPIEDLIYLFMPDRLGALGAITPLAAVMLGLWDVKDWSASDLIRKNAESRIVGVVTAPPVQDMPPIDSNGQVRSFKALVRDNLTGELVGQSRPGQWLTVQNGAGVHFNNPQVTANYGDFYKTQWLRAAAGSEVPYADVSGDLAGTSWTSHRAGRVVYDAKVDQDQWLYLIPNVYQVLWDWTMEAAWLSGALRSSGPIIPVEWNPPKRGSVDPISDSLADTMEVRAGQKLKGDAQRARGYNPTRFRAARKAEIEADKLAGIVDDTNTTEVSFRGSMPVQKAAPTPASDAPGEPAKGTP